MIMIGKLPNSGGGVGGNIAPNKNKKRSFISLRAEDRLSIDMRLCISKICPATPPLRIKCSSSKITENQLMSKSQIAN
ncbi:hypothetical protein MHBO_004639 [Bonamia ostreae]|uniref:Uncharacterized protein n=1 Tax=Bonamia ostreae TaxID=126728 RepID=A0ABV2AUF3_9EUKA